MLMMVSYRSVQYVVDQLAVVARDGHTLGRVHE
jgi:hypothetical protein